VAYTTKIIARSTVFIRHSVSFTERHLLRNNVVVEIHMLLCRISEFFLLLYEYNVLRVVYFPHVINC